MISFDRFKLLDFAGRIQAMMDQAVSLDLFLKEKEIEVALFALNDFYIELHVKQFTDEIIRVRPFRSLKRLDAYLTQINIDDVKVFC